MESKKLTRGIKNFFLKIRDVKLILPHFPHFFSDKFSDDIYSR